MRRRRLRTAAVFLHQRQLPHDPGHRLRLQGVRVNLEVQINLNQELREHRLDQAAQQLQAALAVFHRRRPVANAMRTMVVPQALLDPKVSLELMEKMDQKGLLEKPVKKVAIIRHKWALCTTVFSAQRDPVDHQVR